MARRGICAVAPIPIFDNPLVNVITAGNRFLCAIPWCERWCFLRMTRQSTLNLSAIRSTVMHAQSRWIQLGARVVIIVSCRHGSVGRKIVSLTIAWALSLAQWSILMPVTEHVTVAALVRINRGLTTTKVGVCRCCAGWRRGFELVAGHSCSVEWG